MKHWTGEMRHKSDINIFLLTDNYKLGHLRQYKPGTTKIYSYLTARSDKKLPKVLFFGLQYYLEKYLSIKPEKWMVDEFVEYHNEMIGSTPQDVIDKLNSLVELGYIPLEIKAVPEGTILPVKNVLMTVTNTVPGFHWCVGFFESLLLKVWNTCTTASYSLKYKELCKRYSDLTCDNDGHLPFQVHDFGYRGVSSEETAQLSGSAHLINFMGTDTIPAIKFLKTHYDAKAPVGLSVPASEHSVMCSFGQENELDAFKNMLSLYPTGIVSIVSDTYNLWNVLTNFVDNLYEDIVNRDGKVVFRPDSGNPEEIINGTRECNCNTYSVYENNNEKCEPECKGALELLWEKFSGTINSKGYKVLNPKVGLIYGDGMYYERFERILSTMKENGFASSNLVIGVGGLLLQQHNRDDQGYAIKATYAEIDGKPEKLLKDPVTDPGKKSHTGLLCLYKDDLGYFTADQCTHEQEQSGELKQVFLNGKITRKFTFDEVKRNANVLA